MKYWLDKREEQNPPTHVVVRLAELVLELNAFTFNGKFFQQTSGVAMGTKMGPVYACLFLAYLEDQFFSSYSGPSPSLYKRFIDDLVFFFSLPAHEIDFFLDKFTKIHPSLKFSINISHESIPFLDTTLIILPDSPRIRTSMYYKETDAHAYLDYNSCHSKALLNSIPYSQFLRVRRICSDDTDFYNQINLMHSFFRNRNYPDELINTAKNKGF